MLATSHRMIVEILEALSDAERVDQAELEYNLSDYVDPVIFERLASMEGMEWTFTFQVEEHEVSVTNEGQLFVDDVLCQHAMDGGENSGSSF